MSNEEGVVEAEDEQQPPQGEQKSLPVRQIALSVAGFMIPLIVLAIFMNTVGLPRLQELARDSGPLGAISYITVKALAFVIAPLSSGPLQMASGPIFSIELAVLYTLIGDVIGGSISFLIARYLGRNLLERIIGAEDLEKMDNLYRGRVDKWYTLAGARVIFFFMWDVLSYAAGLTKTVSFITYFLVSVIVGFPVIIVSVTVGERLFTDVRLLAIFSIVVVVIVALLFLFRRQLASFAGRFQQDSETVQE